MPGSAVANEKEGFVREKDAPMAQVVGGGGGGADVDGTGIWI